MKIKTHHCLAIASVALLTTIANPVSAGWLDKLITPAAYEEIAAPEAINPPVQGEPSILIENAPIAQPEAYPAPQAYESYAPVYPPAPLNYVAPVHRGGHAVCCKQPRVIYHNHPILALLMHKCKTGHATKVIVEVPTGCCPAEVTVCVPISCAGCVPKMTKTVDLLGRCVYQYCWPCGTKIKIVQRHTGDLVVHSYEL